MGDYQAAERENQDATAQSEAAPVESKRDRVRRLLIEPLQVQGMRFKHGTKSEIEQKRLDRMADDLSYMSDDGLRALRRCLRLKGEGAAKRFWPERITWLSIAHSFEPRLIEDYAPVIGWFASAAGAAAAAVPGRAVAEFEFWRQHWHPPFDDRHHRAVAAKAAENAAKFEYCAARDAENSLRDPELIAWLRDYRSKEARVAGWISAQGAT